MARGILVNELIIPSLIAGKIVILDRFEDSSWVYQGLMKGLSSDLLMEYRQRYIREIKPDITFLLDAPYKTIVRRLENQMATNYDPADELTLEEYSLIRSAYTWLSRQEPFRWKVIDTNKPITLVAQEINIHTEMLLNSVEPNREIRPARKER